MAPGFCSGCGQALAPGSAFCGRCGSEVHLLPGSSSTPDRFAPNAPSQSHPVRGQPSARKTWTVEVIVISVVVVVVVLLLLAFVPVPQTSSFKISSNGLQEGAYSESFPTGANVTGHWTTQGGQSVTLSIGADLLSLLYTASGSSGSFAFTAGQGPYLFVVDSSGTSGPVTTSVSLTVTAPLL
jgi:hypothetical protein